MFNKIKEFFLKAFFLRRAKGNIGIHSGLSKEICTHGEQFPTQAESEDPDFFGIHFEGLGNVWSAMFTPERININDVLSWIINVGKVRNNSHAFYEEEDMLVALFEAPESGNIRGAVLVVNTEGGKGTQLYSSYPVMQGLSNELVITNFYTWSNGVEGVVAAQLGKNGPPITFFAPFYFRDFTKFTPGAQLTVSLGALAFKLSKAEDVTFKVDRKDLPSRLSLAGAKILLPSGYVCEWSFRCTVLEVHFAEFMEQQFTMLTAALAGFDGQDLRCVIYVAEHVLRGYEPKVGDDIEGVLWMSGMIA